MILFVHLLPQTINTMRTRITSVLSTLKCLIPGTNGVKSRDSTTVYKGRKLERKKKRGKRERKKGRKAKDSPDSCFKQGTIWAQPKRVNTIGYIIWRAHYKMKMQDPCSDITAHFKKAIAKH